MAERLPTDAAPRPGQFVRHRELFIGALGGLMVGGLVAGAVAVFGPDPQPVTVPAAAPVAPAVCAKAAEAWATLDVNWQVYTFKGQTSLTGGEFASIDEGRADAQVLLDQCRAEVGS